MNKAVEIVAKRIADLTKNIGELENEYELHPDRKFTLEEKIQMAKEVLEVNKSLMATYLNEYGEQEQVNAH